MSLTPTNSTAVCLVLSAARSTFLPMRPNPLIATRTAMRRSLCDIGNDGPTECDGPDGPGACLLQGPGRGRQGCARGENVVHENQCGMLNVECGILENAFIPPSAFPIPHLKRPRHIR